MSSVYHVYDRKGPKTPSIPQPEESGKALTNDEFAGIEKLEINRMQQFATRPD